MKKILIILALLYCVPVYSKTFDLGSGVELSASVYIGWKQIISDVKFDQIPSEPEIGLTTSLKLTDRITVFNQFKYGENIDDVLVYNHISYDLPIPIDYFTVTLKGGRLLHDTFLYNSTRINPRTRQGVFQSQSVTWDSLGVAIVSGTGVGADVKYKNLTVSYIADKMTIINPDLEAQAWANNPLASNLKSGFDAQSLVLNYDVPEYGLRTKFWMEKESFDIDIVSLGTLHLGGEHFGVGAEWSHNNFIVSGEVMGTKRIDVNWGQWKEIFFAPSFTLEYEIDDNWTIRGNYNQYRTPSDSPAPEVARYYKDINFGVNWHYNNMAIGAQVNYIQGGRLVAPNNVFDKPSDYDSYFVTGLNVVYFFD
jgi:hypothetical protein